MMPSDGLVTIAGSGSNLRRPGLSSRVKQACRLLNCVCLASERSRSENSFHSAMDASRTSGFSIFENQPMKRVSAARGTRLVSRKLRSSCWVKEAIRLLTVMNLSAGVVSAGGHDGKLDSLCIARDWRRRDGRRRSQGKGPHRTVACQAPLARRPFQDVAPDLQADPAL